MLLPGVKINPSPKDYYLIMQFGYLSLTVLAEKSLVTSFHRRPQ